MYVRVLLRFIAAGFAVTRRRS